MIFDVCGATCSPLPSALHSEPRTVSTPLQNQHYVSQVLLRRFIDSSGFLKRFSLRRGEWNDRQSTRSVFSSRGYTQLIINGTVNNCVEDAFGVQESNVPIILHALDDAATREGTTDLGEDVFGKLCFYCAFLWSLSPFVKAVAPQELVRWINLELEKGKTDTLKELSISEADIATLQGYHSKGKKIIIEVTQSNRQALHRVFAQKARKFMYVELRACTDWSICRSPLELPISDVAFARYHLKPGDVKAYYLPVSPHLVVLGKTHVGAPFPKTLETKVQTVDVPANVAEDFRDAICLSAITAVACKSRLDDIPARRQRAKESGLGIPEINDLESILSAGEENFNGQLNFLASSDEDYEKFMKLPLKQ
jgi:hypothetical protein